MHYVRISILLFNQKKHGKNQMNTQQNEALRRAVQHLDDAALIFDSLGYTSESSHVKFCAMDARIDLQDDPAPARITQRPGNVGVWQGGTR